MNLCPDFYSRYIRWFLIKFTIYLHTRILTTLLTQCINGMKTTTWYFTETLLSIRIKLSFLYRKIVYESITGKYEGENIGKDS